MRLQLGQIATGTGRRQVELSGGRRTKASPLSKSLPWGKWMSRRLNATGRAAAQSPMKRAGPPTGGDIFGLSSGSLGAVASAGGRSAPSCSGSSTRVACSSCHPRGTVCTGRSGLMTLTICGQPVDSVGTTCLSMARYHTGLPVTQAPGTQAIGGRRCASCEQFFRKPEGTWRLPGRPDWLMQQAAADADAEEAARNVV